MNQLVDRLLEKVRPGSPGELVVDAILYAGATIEPEDSDERDEFLYYAERILDAYGIESTSGSLNRGRYWFDPR